MVRVLFFCAERVGCALCCELCGEGCLRRSLSARSASLAPGIPELEIGDARKAAAVAGEMAQLQQRIEQLSAELQKVPAEQAEWRPWEPLRLRSPALAQVSGVAFSTSNVRGGRGDVEGMEATLRTSSHVLRRPLHAFTPTPQPLQPPTDGRGAARRRRRRSECRRSPAMRASSAGE